jgi:hypothetical protein
MSANKDTGKTAVVKKQVVSKTDKIKNLVLNKARNLKLVNTEPELRGHQEAPADKAGMVKGASAKQQLTKYTKA